MAETPEEKILILGQACSNWRQRGFDVLLASSSVRLLPARSTVRTRRLIIVSKAQTGQRPILGP